MKKVLAVVAVVCVVFVAGAAFAQNSGREGPRRMPAQFQQRGMDNERGPRSNEWRMPCERDGMPGGFARHMFTPDMPDEIRAKAVEAAKLRIDLAAVMFKKPVDKAKAIEIYGAIQKAEQEVEMWKFSNKLEKMEEFAKQWEQKRKAGVRQFFPQAPDDKAE